MITPSIFSTTPEQFAKSIDEQFADACSLRDGDLEKLRSSIDELIDELVHCRIRDQSPVPMTIRAGKASPTHSEYVGAGAQVVIPAVYLMAAITTVRPDLIGTPVVPWLTLQGYQAPSISPQGAARGIMPHMATSPSVMTPYMDMPLTARDAVLREQAFTVFHEHPTLSGIMSRILAEVFADTGWVIVFHPHHMHYVVNGFTVKPGYPTGPMSSGGMHHPGDAASMSQVLPKDHAHESTGDISSETPDECGWYLTKGTVPNRMFLSFDGDPSMGRYWGVHDPKMATRFTSPREAHQVRSTLGEDTDIGVISLALKDL